MLSHGCVRDSRYPSLPMERVWDCSGDRARHQWDPGDADAVFHIVERQVARARMFVLGGGRCAACKDQDHPANTFVHIELRSGSVSQLQHCVCVVQAQCRSACIMEERTARTRTNRGARRKTHFACQRPPLQPLDSITGELCHPEISRLCRANQ